MNDFAAGLVGGLCGLAVGHPLDTVKALIQTRNHKSIIESSKMIIKQTNSKGFFRGLTLPFLSYGPINSFLFGIYGNSLRFFNNDCESEPPLKYCFISGTIAGTFTTIPNTPLEVIKIQLQTHNQQELLGLKDCVRKIYKTRGLFGFFRGFTPLMYRDTFSYGFYFFSFELLRRKCKEKGMKNRMMIDFYCGGISGTLAWLSIIPLDVVKSRMQANINDNLNVLKCLKLIYKESGFQGYFKGLAPMLIRGFLVSSVTFSVHFQTLGLINRNHLF